MHRREILKGLALASASVVLSSCAAKKIHAGLPGTSCLPRVDVSMDRITRSICGLRPYRRSGFVVRPEKIGDTLVVHNYGHGGAGITLSWGTSKLAVDMGTPGYSGTVGVLGCGVVGLSTARLLQEAGFAVTIYAKDLPPNTTSNVAGGWWYPVTLFDGDFVTPAFDEQFAKACKYAFERYQIMMGSRYGVRWSPSYQLSHKAFHTTGIFSRQGVVGSLTPEFRDVSAAETPFRGYEFARQFDTMLIEPPIYLTALTQDFEIAGGKIVVRELHDPAEIGALPEKLVFNCTGLGSKALFSDAELTPVKGQLTFLLPQPEVEYSVVYGGGLYMFSRHDGVLLGGTHEEGNWSLDVDMQVRDQIVAKQKEFFDGMKGC
ncbi:MAG TPA: FAD-dependent oxidoreductase [Candidatus Eisenbacteria bacterium]|nr:FAD-dependent oxidoreductase [Candidatus Eisenbacteria bacterium]